MQAVWYGVNLLSSKGHPQASQDFFVNLGSTGFYNYTKFKNNVRIQVTLIGELIIETFSLMSIIMEMAFILKTTVPRMASNVAYI